MCFHSIEYRNRNIEKVERIQFPQAYHSLSSGSLRFLNPNYIKRRKMGQKGEGEEDFGAEMEGSSESRLFSEFKHLGLISTEVPCLLRYIHKRRENFVITCNGRSFHTFVGQQLRLISTTDEAERVRCMGADTYHVYTVGGSGAEYIMAWRRGAELSHKYSTKEHQGPVTHLLPFGENLVSIDWNGGLCVFNIRSEELVRTIGLPMTAGKISAVMHPLTFQNKILIAHSEGLLTLWNINTNKMIYQFDNFAGKRINAIEQSPARGVVALALSSKEVVLFNIEYGVILLKFECIEEPVSVAFRTDGHDVMMVGGALGSITAWDLNTEQMISFVKEAHKAPVSGLVAFMSEPIFVTSSSDNAVRVWIFDKPDGGFRLLNAREGHVEPPTMVRFHGHEIPTVLSTGMDNTLRTFHLYNETYNRIISNFPSKEASHNGVPVNAFTNYGAHHQPIGEDIIAYNKFEPGEAYTFSYLDCKRGKSILSENSKLVITCAQVTTDQQWVVIGFKQGLVQLSNLQSKRLKSTIKVRDEAEVLGLALSSTESTILVGSTKYISTHKFPKGETKEERKLAWPVRSVVSRHSSNLCAIVLGNFEILVCNVSPFEVIRRLDDCNSPVTDASFSPDMKWMTAATDDGCIRTWDVPTGNLIDIFRTFPSPVTSLDFSPRGDFLVTSHAYEVGIKLWINRCVFETYPTLTRIRTNYIPNSPLDKIPRSYDDEDSGYGSQPAISHHQTGIIPKFHWKDLLNLSTIKARNKPVAAFKPKQVIPFLLSELEQNKEEAKLDESPTPALAPLTSTRSSVILASDLAKELDALQLDRSIKINNDHQNWLEKLGKLGPSQLDMEIRSWDPDFGGSRNLLHQFVILASKATASKESFQFIQSCLALFLKVHRKHITQLLLEDDNFLHHFVSLANSTTEERDHLLSTSHKVESLIDYSTESLY